MNDPRLARLAEVLTSHSTRLQKGERVLIEAFDVPEAFTNALIEAAIDCGAIPIVETKHNKVLRQLYRKYGEEAFRLLGEIEKFRMERMDAYIGVRGNDNICEMSDVPGIKMSYLQRHIFQPVHHDLRLKRKWVVLRYPNSSMAQQAGMSTEAFDDFFFEVCTMDYGRMTEAMQALKDRMESADRVQILGPDTELNFSIKGIPAIPCGGEYNIPDGECFTAPVRSSVNGVISFNTPTIYQGVAFSDIKLEFRNGKIIDATGDSASKSSRLNEIFNTDEGARYVGEFSFGFNPFINRPMLDILFDEKIAGSFHFTPGNAYENADNGNRSQIHWDMVMIQTPEFGGGEIWLDSEMIRKDGRFVPDYLQPLNPENLKSEYDDFSTSPSRRRRTREKIYTDEVLV